MKIGRHETVPPSPRSTRAAEVNDEAKHGAEGSTGAIDSQEQLANPPILDTQEADMRFIHVKSVVPLLSIYKTN